MITQLVPAEAVQDQKDGTSRLLNRSREPIGATTGRGQHEARHDAGQTRSSVVGNHGNRHRSSSPHLESERPGVDAATTYDDLVRVSTRGDYACRALLSLTLHCDEPGPTSVRDIAERTGLPQPYLEQILLALKGAGLVRSKRGVGGGYTLARRPEDIALSDVVSAVDGPIVVGDFGEPHQNGSCDHEGQCVLLAIWKQTGEHMRHHLEGFSLADVAAAAQGQGPWPEPLHH